MNTSAITLMVTISTHGISPALYPKLPYDPQKDFAPIANIGLTPQVLMTSLKSGITSVPELIAKAKTGETVIIEDWPNDEFRALVHLDAFADRYLYVSRTVDGPKNGSTR